MQLTTEDQAWVDRQLALCEPLVPAKTAVSRRVGRRVVAAGIILAAVAPMTACWGGGQPIPVDGSLSGVNDCSAWHGTRYC